MSKNIVFFCMSLKPSLLVLSVVSGQIGSWKSFKKLLLKWLNVSMVVVILQAVAVKQVGPVWHRGEIGRNAP